VVGWTSIPEPWDLDYPIPMTYGYEGDDKFTSNLYTMKPNDYYYSTIAPLEAYFKNHEILRTMTLGQFGMRLECTIHLIMHNRWSQVQRPGQDYRANGDPLVVELDRAIPDKFATIEYDWLADHFSSPGNYLLYKLHGWIDDRIQDWKTANRVQEIDWEGLGAWAGPLFSRRVLREDGDEDFDLVLPPLEDLEKAAKVIVGSGLAKHYTEGHYKDILRNMPKFWN